MDRAPGTRPSPAPRQNPLRGRRLVLGATLAAFVAVTLVAAGVAASTSDAPAGPVAPAGPAGPAGSADPVPSAGPHGSTGPCAPPCGYIDPILDLEFPDKRACAAPLGERPDPATCHTLAPGERLVLEGRMVWWWDISQDGTYPLDPAEDIEITFTATKRDPAWLPFAVDPPSFTLSNADLADPANLRNVEQPGSAVPRTYFWYERPVTLTMERTGDPPAEEADLLADRGFASVFVKAKSTASGERFRAAFGIEEVRVATATAGQDAPTPGPVVVMALLGLAATCARAGRRGP